MDLAYVAHSAHCALLLDAEGVCLWVVPKVEATDNVIAAAKRCVGAQYVASLDPNTAGYLVQEPSVGASLLFALVNNGRVALVRFGPIKAFEKLDAKTEPTEQAAATIAASANENVDGAPGSVANETSEEALPPTVAEVPALDDLIVTFTGDSVRVLEASTPPRSESKSAAAEADVRPPTPPFSKATVDAVDQSLDRVAALTSEPPRRKPTARADGPDDSQLDIITGSFARSERIAALLESELELDTGSFMRVSSADLESDPTMAETATDHVPFRPSGFIRRTPEVTEDAAQELSSADDTRRFSRASH